MKQSNTSKYSYLAGVIDSDGCIRIQKDFNTRSKHLKRAKNISHSLHIDVTQKDGRIINYLYGTFGGRVGTHKSGINKEYYYYWKITSSKAKYVLKRILPFLRYKKKQAEIGIRLQTQIEKRKSNLAGRELTDRDLEFREQLYQEIKKEKKTFIPCAAVETKRSESSEKKVCDSPNIKE